MMNIEFLHLISLLFHDFNVLEYHNVLDDLRLGWQIVNGDGYCMQIVLAIFWFWFVAILFILEGMLEYSKKLKQRLCYKLKQKYS